VLAANRAKRQNDPEYRAVLKARQRKYYTPQRYERTCEVCSAGFVTNQPLAKGCSPMCRAEIKRRRYWQKTRVRRQRKRQGQAEAFTDVEVFDRDGWTCQLCGKPVARAAKWPQPWAAVVDHIVPLVLGGPHTRANVQCAHNRCNAQKGAGGGQQQLRLIG
jgi:5-methylcytosine-specific restriction endonuclease McrA